MRFRHSIAAVALFLAAAPAFAQVVTQAQCEQNRGLVRSGKIGGPAFDPSNPLPTRVISFDDFKKIKWPRGTNPKLFPSAAGQRGRVAPEEGTIYQIDGVDINGIEGCNRGFSIPFIKFSSDINAQEIFSSVPPAKCMIGSKYADAVSKVVDRYTQLYSGWSPADPDTCSGGGDDEKNRRPLRIIGVGYWDDTIFTGTPILTLNPLLYIVELDENGQPIEPGPFVTPVNHAPRTKATYALSVSVSGDLNPTGTSTGASASFATNTGDLITYANDQLSGDVVGKDGIPDFLYTEFFANPVAAKGVTAVPPIGDVQFSIRFPLGLPLAVGQNYRITPSPAQPPPDSPPKVQPTIEFRINNTGCQIENGSLTVNAMSTDCEASDWSIERFPSLDLAFVQPHLTSYDVSISGSCASGATFNAHLVLK